MLTLLDWTYAAPGSLLMQLTELMVRLDSLSHVLCWTDTDTSKTKDMNVSTQVRPCALDSMCFGCVHYSWHEKRLRPRDVGHFGG